MRLKQLMMLIVAMVLAVPTMLAQETVYVAYATGQNNVLKPAADDAQLTYNASTQTYDGQVTIELSGTVARAFGFYTGDYNNPTYYSTAAAGMGVALKFGGGTSVTVDVTPGAKYGWYSSGVNLPKDYATTGSATFNVSLNLATNKLTVSSVLGDGQDAPEAFYVFTSDLEGKWTILAGTLTPTSNGGTTYEGTASLTIDGQRFLLCSTKTFSGNSAIGQKGDVTGSSQTRDVTLSSPGSSTNLNMVAGTTSTIITNPGEYTFTFDYEAMTLKVALQKLYDFPKEIRVLGFGTSAYFPNVTPSDNDPVLTRNNYGQYVGTFDISGTTSTFKFYSKNSDGSYTLYGYTNANRNLALNFSSMDIADGGELGIVTVNEIITGTNAQNNVTQVGRWTVGQYGNSNVVTQGHLTATLDLDLLANTGTATFKMEVYGSPSKLYFLGSPDGNTSTAVTAANRIEATPMADDNDLYEWNVTVPEGGWYFVIGNNTYWQSAAIFSTLASGQGDITVPVGQQYSTVLNQYDGFSYAFGVMHLTTPGDYKVYFKFSTKELFLQNGEIIPDENTYLHVAPLAMTGPWEISADDPVLTEGEDGYLTVTVDGVKAKNGVRFYKKDSFGQPVWIGPKTFTPIYFAQDPVYDADYETGSTVNAWQIASLVNDTEEGDNFTFSINTELQHVIFTDNSKAVAPEAIYVWASNETDDEGNPIYKMIETLNPSADNENIFTGEVEVPANSMFYLNQSATSATTKAYKAAYENFSDAGGSSVSGTPPSVKFVDGQYVVTLYLTGVAPNGAPTTSIAFAAGGKLNFTFDFSTSELTVTEPAKLPEYLQISVAKNGPPTGSVVPAPATDARLEMTGEGVYEGTLDIQTSRMFYFYSVANGEVANTYNSPAAFATMGTPINLTADNLSWPYDEDTEEDAVITLNKAAKTSWIISYGASASMGTFDVKVDLNTMTLYVSVAEKEPEAPETLYLWGTENGYAGTGWKAWENGEFNKAADANVYTLAVSVPECGPFEDATGDGKTDTDTETGFYFFLNSSNETQTGAARIFMPAATDRVIDLTEAGESYKANVTEDKTGASFICLTPGEYTFTFDFDNMLFSATLDELPANDPCTLVLNFEATNFDLDNEAIDSYLTIIDQALLIGSEGEDTGVLTIDSNPYTYTYSTYFPQMSMLQITAKDGYTLNIEADEEVEGLFIQGDQGAGVNWMIQGGALYNVPVTISITKEPNTMTFKFDGVPDAYTHVQAADFNGTTIDLTSDTYVVEYESRGGLSIQANDGYSISVECVTPDFNPNAFTIEGAASNEDNQVIVFGSEAANGYEFVVTVSEAKNKVTFTFEGVDDAYTHVQVASYDGETIDLTSNIYVVEYETVGGLSIQAEEGYDVKVECVTPDADETAYQIQSMNAGDFTSTLVGVYPAANGYNFVVTVSEAKNKVTFTFEGVADAYTHVQAALFPEGETVDLTSNIYVVEYETMGGLSLQAEEGYTISVECVTPDADETAYQIQTMNAGDDTQYVVVGMAAANGYNFVVTVKEGMSAMTFTFEGVADAYTYVEAATFPEGETVDINNNIYKFEYEGQGGLSLQAKEGYALTVECVTPDADENAYQIQTMYVGDYTQFIVFGTAAANGYAFIVNVSVAETEEPVPSNGVRFEFTGVEDGYKLFRFMDMMSEDGDDVEITGNPFDFTYEAVAPLMLGFQEDVDAEEYVWTISCDKAEENGVWTLGEPVMEGQHYQRMLVLYPGAYGSTFVIDIQKNNSKTVNFQFTGDESDAIATAFRNVTAEVQLFNEDFEEEGEPSTLYFDSPDFTFQYDAFAAFVTLLPKEGYTVTSVTADVNEGGDTYMYDPDTQEIAIFGSDFTLTIEVVDNERVGIAAIYDFDGAEGYNVVNMQGVVILRNGNASDLNLLENGMYIINGKKVVVRK